MAQPPAALRRLVEEFRGAGKKKFGRGSERGAETRLPSWEPLTPDGSARLYYRVFLPDGGRLIAVDAAGTGPRSAYVSRSGVCQNQTFFRIREHLEQRGFPVPRLLARAPGDEYYLLEDLGDLSLYARLREPGAAAPSPTEVIGLYRQALSLLLRLQFGAAAGFDPAWCYAGGYYDYELVFNHELNYFLAAFVEERLGLRLAASRHERLQREFAALARRAAAVPGDYFLYRDFQSKNLMLQAGRLRLIDFQGARLGPLYYDLSALLNDPYVDLPRSLRRRLRADYYLELRTLTTAVPSQAEFDHCCELFSLLRTLQTLGAFAFLSRCGKSHFAAYIEPALANLADHLAQLAAHGTVLPELTLLYHELIFYKVPG